MGGTEPLACVFVGAGESLANWWLEHPDESVEALADRPLNVAWIGLKTPAGCNALRERTCRPGGDGHRHSPGRGARMSFTSIGQTERQA